MKIPVIAGLIVVVTASVVALTAQTELPFSHNGRMWNQYDGPTKLAYLEGYQDGVTQTLADAHAAKQANMDLDASVEGLPGGETYGEIIESLDQFYSAPETRIVPIDRAIYFIGLKAAGKSSPDVLEKFRQDLIRVYRDASTGKTQ